MRLRGLALTIILVAFGVGQANACACCTNQGQRYSGVQKLDASRHEQLGQLRFNAAATLYTGERDTDDIKGISTPASDYEMHVAQEGSRWVFDFRDKNGRSGTLILPMPDSISIFEIRASIRVRVGQVPRCTRNG